jgi:hypothetical protein
VGGQALNASLLSPVPVRSGKAARIIDVNPSALGLANLGFNHNLIGFNQTLPMPEK